MSDRRLANAIFVLAFQLKGLLVIEETRIPVFEVRRKVSHCYAFNNHRALPVWPLNIAHQKLKSTTQTLIMQPIFVSPAQEDQERQK